MMTTLKDPDKEYEYLTAQMRYLNDKIIQTSLSFVKLASAIIAGSFYLTVNKFSQYWFPVDLLLFVVGAGHFLIIQNNLRSWQKHRESVSNKFHVEELSSKKWCESEHLMCVLIVAIVLGFIFCNPLGKPFFIRAINAEFIQLYRRAMGALMIRKIVWLTIIYWIVAISMSTFYARKAMKIFTNQKLKDLRPCIKFHQLWLNFLGSIIGWASLYYFFAYRFQNRQWQAIDFGLLLIAFVGVTGHLPRVVLIEKLFKLIPRTVSDEPH